jgi:serine/threonine-protein kinase
LDEERWAQIQSLFLEACELPVDAQSDFVDRHSKDDPELAEELHRLLRGHKRQSVLDGDIEVMVAQVFDEPEVKPLEMVGPYRLEKALGAGGMGTVFLATREDWKSKVAIKMPRDVWISSDRLQRFSYEQILLARLAHSSIARIYESGTLTNGTPWFAMEYVDGLPINKHCQQQNLSIQRRLELFLLVCHAVQYAHSQAIIHRDLKPSNILVTSSGEIKLLDFGIGKQMGALLEDSAVTKTGLHPVTLAYAAPEQILLNDISTQTDVYSLGVVLYEMLTGKLPFEVADLTPAQAEKIISTTEPLKPSAVAQDAALGKAAWKDLDALCLKAISKERARRYQSVESLCKDVDSYLHQKPLAARPDDWFYKARKFSGRNRKPILIAAIVIVAVLGLVSYFTFRLAQSRSAAISEAARSKLIEDFLISLFDSGDEAGPGQDMKVSTILKTGELQAAALSGDPRIQSDLYQVLGSSYRKLGQLNRADALLDKALTIRKSVWGNNSPQLAETEMEMANAQADESHFDRAEQLAKDAVRIQEQVAPHDDAQLANALVALGRVLVLHGSARQAMSLFERAVLLQKNSKATLSDRATALSALAVAHEDILDLPIARKLQEQAAQLDLRIYGDSHPKYAADLMNLASNSAQQGQYAEAESDYRAALKINRKWYGENHSLTAMNMMMLGYALVREGKLDEASKILSESLAIQTLVTKGPSPNLAFILDNLGGVALRRNQLKEAADYYQRALAMNRTVFGETNPRAAQEMSNLADVYVAGKDYPPAESLYRHALDLFAKNAKPENLNAGLVRIKIGHTLLLQKRFQEAEPFLTGGYDVVSKQMTATTSLLVQTRADLVTLYNHLKQPAKADKFSARVTAP